MLFPQLMQQLLRKKAHRSCEHSQGENVVVEGKPSLIVEATEKKDEDVVG